MKKLHLKINGIVQGVFFRKSTLEFVEKNCNQLKGHVKNLDDGSVEVFALGPQEDIQKLIEFCNHGPPAARVTSVEHLESNENTNNLQKFYIKY
ncbi:MAG: acylphosphatase [Halobacteriovoraceae bacterium]|nr:acylphosphatase [Halobacteriovoraceae bacterium]